MKQSRDIVALLAPHTQDEEEGLAPERLRTMLDLAGMEALGRALEDTRNAALARLAAAGISVPSVPVPTK